MVPALRNFGPSARGRRKRLYRRGDDIYQALRQPHERICGKAYRWLAPAHTSRKECAGALA